ncbi:sigma-70 family RNA polymerase sigma factor [Paenirhodobacter sp.]|uniref:sigma-70 family RNA polymerase sigma factor n=1 Tax=Paenirhodobacter sp. TaxID=1965326 RepID=UPI003B3D75FC
MRATDPGPETAAMSSFVLQLGSLFRSERHRLLRRVRHVVRCRTEAEDLVQEVFVNLLRGEDRLSVGSPRNYLARAATNAALDHLRRQQVREAVLDHGRCAASVAAPQPGAEAIVQSRQELAILHRAIDGLPVKCRVVFLLSREHGLTMREIAGRLGISEKTVEKHLLKAMTRLRAALRAAGRDI